ncbi:pirin-like C-terminal cupin domain-containing protein [Qipengyuania sp. MTN3-11]|uniref:pirin-like C-terminal cupin domain-containing protein n=1 Tax=Qipengyuania sp. MTN3-11 TaxID=3056557 RepID=UPI0036F194B4
MTGGPIRIFESIDCAHLILGNAYGLTPGSETHSPMFYAHLDMAAGAVAELPDGYSEHALVEGAVEVDSRRFAGAQILVLRTAGSPLCTLERSTVMVLEGEPAGERHMHWNFVSELKDRLVQTAADW